MAANGNFPARPNEGTAQEIDNEISELCVAMSERDTLTFGHSMKRLLELNRKLTREEGDATSE